MNLYIRFLIVFIASFFRPRVTDILKGCSVRLRVLPNDLDTNMHMNNGRYLTLMDLGRLDLVLRTGLMRMMVRQKSVPVLGSVKIRFRIPLHVFEPFDLETRVICWDEKWVYLEQRFIVVKGPKAGAVAAIALLKGGFYDRRKKTTVPTQALLDALGMNMQSPSFPPYIADWQKAEESLRSTTA